MYFYFHGMVTYHLKNAIVIDCNGVGYDILVSHPDEFTIGEELFVFVVYEISENEQYFVGFKTLEEKELYLSLTSVKGIGPKTALNALSSTSVDRLKTAINNSEELFLTKLPGIGKKSASQIILDLKGKLVTYDSQAKTFNANMDLALDALKNLGFKDKEAKDALNMIERSDCSVEEYVRLALQNIKKK